MWLGEHPLGVGVGVGEKKKLGALASPEGKAHSGSWFQKDSAYRHWERVKGQFMEAGAV